jgi:phospholipase C
MPMPAQITHVVVLMMENHSFDRALGCMQTVDPRIEGVDPAHPRANPNWPNAAPPIPQGLTESRAIDKDPGHDLDNVLRQIANSNQGFVADFAQKYPSTAVERSEIMAYYPHGFLPALHYLADNFVVCDHWFSSLPGPTWPNRFFAHSGTSLGRVDMPEGIFNPSLHLYDQRTLYDELDDANVDWRIYYGDFPQSLLMTHQLDKLGHYRKFDQWAADVGAGNLPPYVFIEPSYFSTEENDQHPPQDVMRGDLLIANVFNALLANQSVFEKTLLVVLYDEHGGFYDHVEPPATVPPDRNTQSYAFNQYGVRVPAILVSPWLAKGCASMALDHTSLLKMASRLWPGVQPLGARTVRANDPSDAVNWLQLPRHGIGPAPLTDVQAIIPQPQLTGQKQALFQYSQYLESKISDPAVKANLANQAYDAMSGAIAQGELAIKRLKAYLAEHQPPSEAQSVANPG